MIGRILVSLAALAALVLAGLYILGSGVFGRHWGAANVTPRRLPAALIQQRARSQSAAARAIGAASEPPSQILFGDLHVHSTYSTDAFLMSLPAAGGDGAHPVADACDFARFCSGLDFWSINDHALALTPRRWAETVDAVRQCNDVAGDPANPDVAAFLGWEWTQIGDTPETHFGHKNVILRHLDDARIPTRPIAAPRPDGGAAAIPSPFALGLLAAIRPNQTSLDIVRYFRELDEPSLCPSGVPVRELPDDCHEVAATPRDLFAKLDDWGHEAMVIPHGTTWGYYTPLGSSWDKQLSRAQHDPARQRLIEVYSGHGNSEEHRDWREIRFGRDGDRSCPEPTANFLPSCWRAGEIIRDRCMKAAEPASTCEARAADARANYLQADISGHLTVPGVLAADWLDSGQCRDCFHPAFNYRPRTSVQYIMALGETEVDADQDPLRFRFGFIASSDNHSARPGTGYKEFARSEMTEARFDRIRAGLPVEVPAEEPVPMSRPLDPDSGLQFFGLRESERQASFFVLGGLVGAHARGRSRDAVWEALARKETYGTSGPRIQLWFDLVNESVGRLPMGSEVAMRETPIFEVRAVGSFVQKPGCPEDSVGALPAERLERLCRGECYHPSDERRQITRIEVVRIRPRIAANESVASLIEDPWRVYSCEPDPVGCSVRFGDEEFALAGRDTSYYVRAIEQASPAVNAANLRCEFDERGRCIATHPCPGLPADDDCLVESEQRAWSSPVFVDFDTAS